MMVLKRSMFAVTPHKVSVCILIQTYATPGPFFLPQFFSSVSHHNSFALFLLSLIKSYDDISEPKLDDLICQLREVGGLLDQRLTLKLSSLSQPDDLFNIFSEFQGILGGPESGVLEDDQISLDSSSNLGIFLRRCILAFSVLSFEGVCHLLSDVESYRKVLIPEPSSFESCNEGSGRLPEYENMDLDNFGNQEATEDFQTKEQCGEEVSFHLHVPRVLDELAKGVEVPATVMHGVKASEKRQNKHCEIDVSEPSDSNPGIFLRANWQIHGYLLEQAEEIEKHGSSFSLNIFDSTLKQLQKLAPDLHRVHFLRYLNMLYHDDYSGALDNLHRYFDYRMVVGEGEGGGMTVVVSGGRR